MGNIVELVRLGFHGVAVAMLILGFWLLRAVIVEKKQPIDPKVAKEVKDAEITKLKLKLKSVRNYLLISLVFFVLGVGSEMYKQIWEKTQENEMTVQLQPEAASMPDIALMPTLLKEDDPIPLPIQQATSTFKIKVKHGQRFYLQLHTLTNRVENLTNRVNQLLLANEKESAEGGLEDEI